MYGLYSQTCGSFQIKTVDVKLTQRKFYFEKINTFRYTVTDWIQLCAFNADIKTHYYYVTMRRKP